MDWAKLSGARATRLRHFIYLVVSVRTVCACAFVLSAGPTPDQAHYSCISRPFVILSVCSIYTLASTHTHTHQRHYMCERRRSSAIARRIYAPARVHGSGGVRAHCTAPPLCAHGYDVKINVCIALRWQAGGHRFGRSVDKWSCALGRLLACTPPPVQHGHGIGTGKVPTNGDSVP